MIDVPVKIFTKSGEVPEYAKHGDSGFDIKALLDKPLIVYQNDTVKIPTGIFVELPYGYEIQVRPRSGNSSKGLYAAFGTIDSGYVGEIGIILRNETGERITIENGQKVAQGVIAPVYRANFTEVESVDEFSKTERGSDGFGSTGK